MPELFSSAAGPAQPRLAPGVRLHFDTIRQVWVLLAPERLIETEGPAHDILSRCDGRRTIDEIVNELAAIFVARREDIETDVLTLLDELAAKRLVTL